MIIYGINDIIKINQIPDWNGVKLATFWTYYILESTSIKLGYESEFKSLNHKIDILITFIHLCLEINLCSHSSAESPRCMYNCMNIASNNMCNIISIYPKVIYTDIKNIPLLAPLYTLCGLCRIFTHCIIVCLCSMSIFYICMHFLLPVFFSGNYWNILFFPGHMEVTALTTLKEKI